MNFKQIHEVVGGVSQPNFQHICSIVVRIGNLGEIFQTHPV